MTTAHTDPLRPPDPVETPRADRAQERYFRGARGEVALWTGVLGGAVAWTVQFLAGYALARFSHDHPWLTAVHHGVSLVAVLAAVGATLLAVREWRRIGGGEPGGTEEGVGGRSRFLAALGIVTSGLFAVVIVAQWVPVFFIDPAWY